MCPPKELTSVKRTVLVALALFAAGCAPTAPSSVPEGIIVFMDTNFSGPFQPFTADIADLEDVNGICGDSVSAIVSNDDWGDCISSIRIAPGWAATVYKDDHYQGQSLTITADTPNLKNVPGPCGDDWNDCISSIRVFRH